MNDRLHYSAKHHRHGVNIQFLTDPHGRLIWASPALRGSTHDLTAARVHGIIDALTSRAIACYADKAYVGAGGAIGTPYKRRKRRKLGKRKKLFNRHHARARALSEQGAAALGRWRILRKARCSPSRLTTIIQAILTSTTRPHEVGKDSVTRQEFAAESLRLATENNQLPYDLRGMYVCGKGHESCSYLDQDYNPTLKRIAL